MGSFLAGFVPVLAEEIEFYVAFLFPGEEEGAEAEAAAEALMAGIKEVVHPSHRYHCE